MIYSAFECRCGYDFFWGTLLKKSVFYYLCNLEVFIFG